MRERERKTIEWQVASATNAPVVPIHLAQARRARRPTLCAHKPPSIPEGEPTETADSFDEDESSFGCGGRLTAELCFSRPANSRAEPSCPPAFLPLSLFLVIVRPSCIRFIRDTTPTTSHRRGDVAATRRSHSRAKNFEKRKLEMVRPEVDRG